MTLNILILSCLVSLGSTAWNQPANSCYIRQFSSCGVVEKLDEILATLKVIAESKLTKQYMLQILYTAFFEIRFVVILFFVVVLIVSNFPHDLDTASQSPTSAPPQTFTTISSTSQLPTSVPTPTESIVTEAPTIPVGTMDNPASSCSDISLDSPSGEYWIQTNGFTSPIQVYCNTNPRNCSCDTTGGWARVANLDMTDPTQQCPVGFKQINRTEPPLRTCGRPDGLSLGCVSAIFPSNGIEYSHVCGKIIGYQVGTPEAFNGQSGIIDSQYVNGISLTYGAPPRQHIWTLTGARAEETASVSDICPCSGNGTFTGTIPSFVGEDYFCDSALRNDTFAMSGVLYPNDPLWDGQGCGSTSTCCSFNNPPWFCKQFPYPTTDDIELRICGTSMHNDSPFEIVELYIN